MATKAKNVKSVHQAQDVQPKGILDRVNAFVNLKFPQTIAELKHVRGQKQIKDIERD